MIGLFTNNDRISNKIMKETGEVKIILLKRSKAEQTYDDNDVKLCTDKRWKREKRFYILNISVNIPENHTDEQLKPSESVPVAQLSDKEYFKLQTTSKQVNKY